MRISNLVTRTTVSGIVFIRYADSQKIEKPNNLNVCE